MTSAAIAIAILAIVVLAASSPLLLTRSKRIEGASTRYGKSSCAVHLLIVLGSGGHTEEMLSMLRHARLNPKIYAQRTYLVSSGDSFSARKAAEFERELSTSDSVLDKTQTSKSVSATGSPMKLSSLQGGYTIITIPRARKVHQSFLTAPFSTLHCIWACLLVLRGRHPDQIRAHSVQPQPQPPVSPNLVLTNGPGIAVCIIVAARLLRLLNCLFAQGTPCEDSKIPHCGNQRRYLRTIFIESWARVTTLSLSGKLVLPLVDRFLVQWESLDGYSSWNGKKAEYVGTLLS